MALGGAIATCASRRCQLIGDWSRCVLGAGKRAPPAAGNGRTDLLPYPQAPPHTHTQHQVGVNWGPGSTGGNRANGVIGASRVLAATPCPSGGVERGQRGQGRSRGEWPGLAGVVCQEVFKKSLGQKYWWKVLRSIWEEGKGPAGWGRLTSASSGQRIREPATQAG